MLSIWGLKTCDTCKKARKWLEEKGIEHSYQDVRADGVSSERLRSWSDKVGWEKLVNKSSTTWRGLADDLKTHL